MKAPRCPFCGKGSYDSGTVIAAAIGTSRTLGKPVRTYPCPRNSRIFHITTWVVSHE